MISNAPTWVTTTTREIEIPTARADGSITISVHNDTFADLQKEYLYVVDSNGNFNQTGYALRTSCPSPPANVRVE